MHFSRARALALAVGTTLLGALSPAAADEVVLRDGSVYTGTVVSESRREVIIDTQVRGISTRITLDRREVRSVVRGMTPTTPPEDAKTDPAPTIGAGTKQSEAPKPAIMKRDGHDLVMEIPMNGTFGQDIYPLAVYNSLQWGVDHGVTDVVFRMNSPGGEVWAAEEIVEIMAHFDDHFRYHALIEHAISATIWPSFNCDTITMTPGATFGGAVVFKRNDSGSAEVDKKLTSIMAAKLSASAEAKGHSPYLVKAMMLSEESVYAVRSGAGWELVNEKPTGDNFETIDDDQHVLTLTAEEAGKYGIVTAVDDRALSTFAEAHDIVDFDTALDDPAEICKEANATCKDLRGELIATLVSFHTEQIAAGERSSIRGVGSAVNSMKRLLGRYRVLLSRAEDLHMDAITSSLDDALDIKYWELWIETRQREIRNATRP